MSLVPRAKVLLLGALAGAVSISTAAQTKLTLEQAVAVALEKNPVRKAAFFEQRAAAAAFKLSRAPLFPAIAFIETCQSPAAQPRSGTRGAWPCAFATLRTSLRLGRTEAPRPWRGSFATHRRDGAATRCIQPINSYQRQGHFGNVRAHGIPY